MLEDIDKPLPFDSGVHLKLLLGCTTAPPSLPRVCALLSLVEQQGTVILLEQPPLNLTEIGTETELGSRVPGPTTSTPESRRRAAGSTSTCSLGGCTGGSFQR